MAAVGRSEHLPALSPRSPAGTAQRRRRSTRCVCVRPPARPSVYPPTWMGGWVAVPPLSVSPPSSIWLGGWRDDWLALWLSACAVDDCIEVVRCVCRRARSSQSMPRVRPSTTNGGGWWGNTMHAFDGVRSPRSPGTPRSARSVGSFGTSPRFSQRRQTDSRESAQSLASSEGVQDFRVSQVFGSHSLNSTTSSLRLDGKMEHRFEVKLPIEKRQGDGGLSSSIAHWLDRGSSLPRDFRHIHLRPRQW